MGCEFGINGNNCFIFLKGGQDGKHSRLHNTRNLLLVMTLDGEHVYTVILFWVAVPIIFRERRADFFHCNSVEASRDATPRGVIRSKKIKPVLKFLRVVQPSRQSIFLSIHSRRALWWHHNNLGRTWAFCDAEYEAGTFMLQLPLFSVLNIYACSATLFFQLLTQNRFATRSLIRL